MLYRISLFLGAIALIGGIEMGCYYDNEEELFGIVDEPGTCDIDSVSYSVDLVPLLDLHCNIACHSSSIVKGGVILDDYDNVTIYVNDGTLLGSIRHDAGFSRMPQGEDKLDICIIELFENWVAEGALDN